MRYDANFWAWFLVGSLVAAALGCLSAAAMAQTAAANTTDIISMSDALSSIDQAHAKKIRVGVMTERVRANSFVVAGTTP